MSNHLQEALETLKGTGVRITPQRHAILEYLINSMTHPTADDIYKALEGKFPNMSVATVYNNLRVFREVGIVKELTYGDASSRFDYVTTEHYHVICENLRKNCGFSLSWFRRSRKAGTLILLTLILVTTEWKFTERVLIVRLKSALIS